ncbi:MAG: putative membrane protein [Cryomorphaceae bacterium]|jgi:uncharacterized membrane protein
MAVFIIGLLLFFSSHFYSAFRSRAPGDDIKEKLGEERYMGVYSLVSILGFGLIVWGYSLIEAMPLVFNGLAVSRIVISILMAAALISLAAAYVPSSNIKRVVKHPMLLGVGLWGLAHILDGATLKQVLLFGSFLLYSIVDAIAASKRDSAVGINPPAKLRNDFIAVGVGLLVYMVIAKWLHSFLFGIPI